MLVNFTSECSIMYQYDPLLPGTRKYRSSQKRVRYNEWCNTWYKQISVKITKKNEHTITWYKQRSVNFLLAAMVGAVSSSRVTKGLRYRIGSSTCHDTPRNASPKMKFAGKYVAKRRNRSSCEHTSHKQHKTKHKKSNQKTQHKKMTKSERRSGWQENNQSTTQTTRQN